MNIFKTCVAKSGRQALIINFRDIHWRLIREVVKSSSVEMVWILMGNPNSICL